MTETKHTKADKENPKLYKKEWRGWAKEMLDTYVVVRQIVLEAKEINR